MKHCLKSARNPVITETEESTAQRSSEQSMAVLSGLVFSFFVFLMFADLC